jgi:hypothetical protein
MNSLRFDIDPRFISPIVEIQTYSDFAEKAAIGRSKFPRSAV